MALSKLSGDEQGVILGQLRNALEPRLGMYFSSANKELRTLLPSAAQQQLRADYEEATALCVKMGLRDCKELREATWIELRWKDLSAANMATLAKLGSVLPALERLCLCGPSGSAGPDGVSRLADGLGAGSLPALTLLIISNMDMGDAGAAALAAALDRGALPLLFSLDLKDAAVGDAGLAALAPALRRRPALEQLCLSYNPLGDEGLAALVAPPPPPAGTPPPPAGGLKKLKELYLERTRVTAAGCATLIAALDSGALPALDTLYLGDLASLAATRAVHEAMARSRFGALYEAAAALCVKLGMQSCGELRGAMEVQCINEGLSEADLATLGALGSELTALEELTLRETSGSAGGPDGVQRLAEGLLAGALPAVTYLSLDGMHVGDAGASALASALDRGALPRLESLTLAGAAIGDAGLAALAPALRRRRKLGALYLDGNPFGDEGLAALLAPRRPAGGLKTLELLQLSFTEVSDAGCATLAAALSCGALPALEALQLEDIPASAAAKDAVRAALGSS